MPRKLRLSEFSSGPYTNQFIEQFGGSHLTAQIQLARYFRSHRRASVEKILLRERATFKKQRLRTLSADEEEPTLLKRWNREAKQHKDLIDATVELYRRSPSAALKYANAHSLSDSELERWSMTRWFFPEGSFAPGKTGPAVFRYTQIVPPLLRLFADPVQSLVKPCPLIRKSLFPSVRVELALAIWGKWALVNPTTCEAFASLSAADRMALLDRLPDDEQFDVPSNIGRGKGHGNSRTAPRQEKTRQSMSDVSDFFLEEAKKELTRRGEPVTDRAVAAYRRAHTAAAALKFGIKKRTLQKRVERDLKKKSKR